MGGLSNLLYSAIDNLIKLSLAGWGIGAEVIAALVASCMYLGIGLGPLLCEGHVGEK